LIDTVSRTFQKNVIWPIHPRTKAKLKSFNITLPEQVFGIDPMGYLDFLQLTTHAAAVLTDSGGVQEEACILRVPCITLRENTERPETLHVRANQLVGL